MDAAIEHEHLESALRRCGASWSAAQAHGLLSGRLAVAGARSGFDWLTQVLEGTDAGNALRTECEVLLNTLYDTTYRQLAERQSEFEPLLPADGETTQLRADALAHWCEGFLHGLVSSGRDDALKARLGQEPLAEIIKDMLQITRAQAGEGEGSAGPPARAGIDRAYKALLALDKRFPRACGDKPSTLSSAPCGCGVSPRVRG